jgi:hypothetical protein
MAREVSLRADASYGSEFGRLVGSWMIKASRRRKTFRSSAASHEIDGKQALAPMFEILSEADMKIHTFWTIASVMLSAAITPLAQAQGEQAPSGSGMPDEMMNQGMMGCSGMTGQDMMRMRSL